jgi:hypothetical protein
MAVNDRLKKRESPEFYEGFKGFISYFHGGNQAFSRVGHIPCSV